MTRGRFLYFRQITLKSFLISHNQIISGMSILQFQIWRSFPLPVYSSRVSFVWPTSKQLLICACQQDLRRVNDLLCFACNRLAAAKLNMETAIEDAEYMAEELER